MHAHLPKLARHPPHPLPLSRDTFNHGRLQSHSYEQVLLPRGREGGTLAGLSCNRIHWRLTRVPRGGPRGGGLQIRKRVRLASVDPPAAKQKSSSSPSRSDAIMLYRDKNMLKSSNVHRPCKLHLKPNLFAFCALTIRKNIFQDES